MGDDPSSGLPYLWSLGISQEVPKQVLITHLTTALREQGFPEQSISSHIDRLHPKISNAKKLPEFYFLLWVTEYVKFFKETLRSMLDEDPKLKDIASELKLGELLGLSDETFSSMFEYRDSRKDHKKVGDYHLLPGSAKDFTFAAMPSKSSSLSQNPYRDGRYGRIMDKSLKKNFQGNSLEFVWLVKWAFLSKKTYDTIETLLSVPAPDTSLFPQNPVGDIEKTYRFFTCLVQAVTTSTEASLNLWQKAYFQTSVNGRGLDRATSQLAKFDIRLLLLMSAIHHTCPFLTKIGVDPARPTWFTQVVGKIEDVSQANDDSTGWGLGKIMTKDYLVFLTASFMAHVKQDYNRKDMTEVEAKRRISASLQLDFPNLTVDHKSEGGSGVFFGTQTIGGVKTFDVRKDGTSGIEFPNFVEAVTARPSQSDPGNSIPPYTYRISDFVPTTTASFDDNGIPTNAFF